MCHPVAVVCRRRSPPPPAPGAGPSSPWAHARVRGPAQRESTAEPGCCRSQATVSAPSAISLLKGSTCPPEPDVPRQLWLTTWLAMARNVVAGGERGTRPLRRRTGAHEDRARRRTLRLVDVGQELHAVPHGDTRPGHGVVVAPLRHPEDSKISGRSARRRSIPNGAGDRTPRHAHPIASTRVSVSGPVDVDDLDGVVPVPEAVPRGSGCTLPAASVAPWRGCDARRRSRPR